MGMKQVQSTKSRQLLVYSSLGVSAIMLVLLSVYFLGNSFDGKANEPLQVEWSGSKSSDWTDPDNWERGRVPSSNEMAVVLKDAKNTPEIAQNRQIKIQALKIEGGQTLKVIGELTISGDLEVESRGTILDIKGKLFVEGGVRIRLRSKVVIGDEAMLSVSENLHVEWAELHNEGILKIGQELRLKRGDSRFVSKSGRTQVNGDVHLQSANNTANQLVVLGGIVDVTGTTKFYKLNENQTVLPKVLVKGGELRLNEMSRDEVNPATYGASYQFEIEAGKLVFEKDALFDTLARTDDRAHKWLGFGIETWKPGPTYSRQHANDIVSVTLGEYIYWLAQDVWWSKDEAPDTSKKWVKKGRYNDLHPGRIEGLPEWSRGTIYKRSGADIEIYVRFENQSYRMNKNCWFSKDNAPANNEWVWLPEFDFETVFTQYDDQVRLNGGSIVFNGQASLPLAFQSQPNGKVVLNGNDLQYNLEATDLGTLEIGAHSALQAGCEIRLTGDLELKTKNAKIHRLKLVGSGDQVLIANDLHVDHWLIDKDSGTVKLSGNVYVNDTLHWLSSTAIIPRVDDMMASEKEPLLVFKSGASYLGNGWYEGKLQKHGREAFVFPVGQKGELGYFGVSESAESKAFSVQYQLGAYGSSAVALEKGMQKVSEIEYWIVDRIEGTAEVWPTLYWSSGHSSGIEKPGDLTVAWWDSVAQKWISLGQRFKKGNATKGSLTSDDRLLTEGIITYGSFSLANTLSRHQNLGGGDLRGMESGELITDSAENQEIVATQVAEEASSSMLTPMEVYPNPIKDHFTISFSTGTALQANLSVYNMSGMQTYQETMTTNVGKQTLSLDGKMLMPEPGNYILVLQTEGKSQSLTVQKR